MLANRSSRLRRRGSYTVEFAVVAPIFLLTMLGIIELGRACMATELLTEAARRACRVAIIEGTGSSSVQTTATNFLTSVGINGESASIYVNDQLASSTTNVSTMPAYTEISVVVTVPVGDVTWTPIRYLSGNLSGQYTMRRE